MSWSDKGISLHPAPRGLLRLPYGRVFSRSHTYLQLLDPENPTLLQSDWTGWCPEHGTQRPRPVTAAVLLSQEDHLTLILDLARNRRDGAKARPYLGVNNRRVACGAIRYVHLERPHGTDARERRVVAEPREDRDAR
jgi:hypothetical protein